jgi:hypothetical protein
LSNDVTAVTGWQDTVAVNTCLKIIGHGEDGGGEEGEDRDSEELHFGEDLEGRKRF